MSAVADRVEKYSINPQTGEIVGGKLSRGSMSPELLAFAKSYNAVTAGQVELFEDVHERHTGAKPTQQLVADFKNLGRQGAREYTDVMLGRATADWAK